MSCSDRDLTLDEALADPVIGAALRADRVDPRQFELLLRTAARRIERRTPPLAPAVLAARACRPAAGSLSAGSFSAW